MNETIWGLKKLNRSWPYVVAQTFIHQIHRPQTTPRNCPTRHHPAELGGRDLWRRRALILHFTNPRWATDSDDVTD